MGFQSTINKIIRELTPDIDPVSEVGKIVQEMLDSIKNDIDNAKDNEEKTEKILIGKLRILVEVISEELQFTEANIVTKLISGGKHDHSGEGAPDA